MAVITLLTDFGLQDEYVGVLKGVIAGINPAATVIDICHSIAPQDVVSAAYMLKAVFAFFPRGTIHVAVVDPEVGSRRDIVAVACDGHIFLAPDNGLLGPLLADTVPQGGYQVENQSLFRQPVSQTFHGRDIFAPVAAHLSMGLPLKAVGRPLEIGGLRMLDIREPRTLSENTVEGEVVAVDRFGNLITNIRSRHLSALGTGTLRTMVRGRTILNLTPAYVQGSTNEPLAIIGSRDCLEIAVNRGNAAALLQVAQGEIVHVKVDQE
jgi:S-adenosyl-L-methionine hydrolase (adenosine-forming)